MSDLELILYSSTAIVILIVVLLYLESKLWYSIDPSDIYDYQDDRRHTPDRRKHPRHTPDRRKR